MNKRCQGYDHNTSSTVIDYQSSLVKTRHQKQNWEPKSYKMNGYINQMVNKYKNSQNFSSKRSLNSVRTNQNEVIRKLQNLKHQLQMIPNWQQYAKGVLFNQYTPTRNSQSKPYNQERKNQQIEINTLHKTFNEDSLSKNRPINNYTMDINSFRAKQGASIQKQSRKYSNKKVQFREELNTYTPSKEISVSKFEPTKISVKSKRTQSNLQNQGSNSISLESNLDRKINQIERKIRQSQLKKKSLGVDFIPFERKSSLLKNNFQQHHRTKTPQNYFRNSTEQIQNTLKYPIKKYRNNSTIKQFNNQSIILNKSSLQLTSPRFALFQNEKSCYQKKQINYKSKYHERQKQHSQRNKKEQIAISLKEKQYFNKERQYQNYQHKLKQKQKQDTYLKNRLVFEKAQQGIKQRKKRVTNEFESKRKKQDTARLVKAFCEQVKLDQMLRNGKLWFKYCKNQKKLLRLKSLLDIEGFNYSINKIEQQFEVHEKQDNPFFSVTSQDYDIETVANSYVECEKFWKRNIWKKFNRKTLDEEDLNNLALDLDRKGYIVLEDLVRFLNMETGTFFRNRDLIAIFRRICRNDSKVSYDQFVNTFCA